MLQHWQMTFLEFPLIKKIMPEIVFFNFYRNNKHGTVATLINKNCLLNQTTVMKINETIRLRY